MKKTILILLLISGSAFADEPVPVVPDAVQKEFERARADEHESAAAHDADVARLQAAFAAAQKACGDKFTLVRPQPHGDLICMPKAGGEHGDNKN